MIDCSFLPIFYEHHQRIKAGQSSAETPDSFTSIENIWMGFYGLGKFETYRFLYSQCSCIEDLTEWMLSLKGEKQIRESAAAFDRWMKEKSIDTDISQPRRSMLNEAQWQHWKEQGFIKVGNLVDGDLCDEVVNLICTTLGADLEKPETWYNPHADWHGLMLQLYQGDSIHAIRKLPAIQQLFSELYDHSNLISNTEKLSFNPPETSSWTFCHNKLHWDIDFDKPDPHYIQGLIYLNDVPENRGPLTVVPGFHHQFKEWMKTYPNPYMAQDIMVKTFTGTPVPGKKGDMVLWLQTLPHAASANHSNQPRFVQYISFSKC